MAKPEHVAMLAQGVRAWNAWRATTQEVADLSGLDLSEEGLRQATAAGQQVSGIELRGADLRRTDLRRSIITMWDLERVDLRGAQLAGAILNHSWLRKADLRGVRGWLVDLSETNLRGADLRGANLRDANLSRSDARRADFRGADLRGANLAGAELTHADLRTANLSRAVVFQATLTASQLGFACLRRAELAETRLRRADLTSSDLRFARLCRTDLREADLRGADLRWSLLRGVRAQGAIFEDARLHGLQASGCDLRAASCTRADMSGRASTAPRWRQFAEGEFEETYGGDNAVEVGFAPSVPPPVALAVVAMLDALVAVPRRHRSAEFEGVYREPGDSLTARWTAGPARARRISRQFTSQLAALMTRPEPFTEADAPTAARRAGALLSAELLGPAVTVDVIHGTEGYVRVVRNDRYWEAML
jgi:uncharacterized protein YjbI with pentapeptide repeats